MYYIHIHKILHKILRAYYLLLVIGMYRSCKTHVMTYPPTFGNRTVRHYMLNYFNITSSK